MERESSGEEVRITPLEEFFKNSSIRSPWSSSILLCLASGLLYLGLWLILRTDRHILKAEHFRFHCTLFEREETGTDFARAFTQKLSSGFSWTLLIKKVLTYGSMSEILVVYHLPQIPRNSAWDVNGKRFFGSSHWKIPGTNGNSEKVVPFFRLGRSEWKFVYYLQVSFLRFVSVSCCN